MSETAGSGMSYQERADAHVLLVAERSGMREYESVFFTRRDSGIKDLADLRGKRIAFQNPASTSAYFLPASEMLSAGLPLVILTITPFSSFRPGQAEEARPWTVLLYGAADNNCDGPLLEYVELVRKAIDDDPGLELLLFIDRHKEFSADATLLGEDFTGEGARLG